MGTTGLIFGVLVAAWLAYLVPSYLNRRDQSSVDVEHTLNFTDDAKLLRLSENSDPVQPTAEVSTPLLRAALRRELHVRSLRAARRRTRILLLLVLTVVLLTVTTVLGLTRWWTAAAGGAALVVWLFASRWSTARMYRRLDAELADVELSDDEETIAIAIPTAGLDDDLLAEHELSIEISGPVPTMSLWDPIPVTPITYVSRPLTPRTVRTIDLSAPAAPAAVVPVTADAGLETEVREHRRASGE